MNGLQETKLELNIPTSPEDLEFQQKTETYIRVFQEIGDVFIRNKLTIEEGMEVLALTYASCTEFLEKGMETVKDMMKYEGE